jgi:hypothetical protein
MLRVRNCTPRVAFLIWSGITAQLAGMIDIARDRMAKFAVTAFAGLEQEPGPLSRGSVPGSARHFACDTTADANHRLRLQRSTPRRRARAIVSCAPMQTDASVRMKR